MRTHFARVRAAGPYSSDLTSAAAEIAKNYSAVMVAPAAASTSVYKDRPFVFGIARYPVWHGIPCDMVVVVVVCTGRRAVALFIFVRSTI